CWAISTPTTRPDTGYRHFPVCRTARTTPNVSSHIWLEFLWLTTKLSGNTFQQALQVLMTGVRRWKH
ncbi:bacteriophage integrase, partial [Salmonella enterica subsp. enterica serovar Rissen]